MPRFDILPRMVRSPVEICLGTNPSHAAKSRPLEKLSPVPIAATMALAERFGTINALAIMAGGALVVLFLLLAALAWEDRRHRRLAARRAALDRELARAAALSLVGDARPSRPVIGLGLVAIGALMVLLRRDRD